MEATGRGGQAEVEEVQVEVEEVQVEVEEVQVEVEEVQVEVEEVQVDCVVEVHLLEKWSKSLNQWTFLIIFDDSEDTDQEVDSEPQEETVTHLYVHGVAWVKSLGCT